MGDANARSGKTHGGADPRGIGLRANPRCPVAPPRNYPMAQKTEEGKKPPIYPALRNRPWSPAEEAKLRGLWSDGTTLSLISRALGRSSSGVSQKAKRLGLHSRYQAKPKQIEPARPGFKEKKCLRCRDPFQASRFIFLCKTCKHHIARIMGC